ncbi:MAG TPA: hypothetical protein VFZ65_08045 [Planctomycetota bacterium]|nr:hypothetical protein [Planctomycetota bacterium]
MLRSLASLASISLLVAASHAQCFEQNFGVLAPIAGGAAGYGDDVLFDLQPMNITFPMGGVAASYTHAHICSNGVLYLTNGAPSNGTTYAYQTTAFFVGAAGQDPRIAPLWIDLDSVATNGGGVYFNNTIPGKFVVTWANIVEWATQGPTFTLQAQLFANGDVAFYYSSTVYGISVGYGSQFVSRSGITAANGIADPGSVDLSAGGNISPGLAMYEEFPLNVFDLQDKSVTFINIGTSYVQTVSACAPAFHESYGSGCYNLSDSFYQFHADASTAPTFSGHSLTMTPAGNSYLVAWGGGTFVTPVGATSLTIADDGEVAQAPSVPFPTAAGPVSPLYIGANGLVSMAANSTSANYIPDANSFLNSPVTAFYSWHDFNPTEAGSGPVQYHEGVVLGETIAYVTWNGVENYPTGVVNPSTWQLQLNLTTGVVKFVWQTMDGDITSPFGSAHLMGWSPGGPSTDGGSLNLATTSPFVVQSPNIFAMKLTASPAPISNTTLGTVVTYTTNNMREYASGGGVYIGLTILSLSQIAGGLDLGFLGAPGCNAYVGTLDLPLALVGVTPTNSVGITLPTMLPVGTQIFSQSIGLITPNSMPNGQNAFGLLVSNGVRTYISTF